MLELIARRLRRAVQVAIKDGKLIYNLTGATLTCNGLSNRLPNLLSALVTGHFLGVQFQEIF